MATSVIKSIDARILFLEKELEQLHAAKRIFNSIQKNGNIRSRLAAALERGPRTSASLLPEIYDRPPAFGEQCIRDTLRKNPRLFKRVGKSGKHALWALRK